MRAIRRFNLTLAAFALVAAPLAADESAGFSLNLDRLDIAIYDVDVDTNSSKFNEYRDWDSGFAIPKLEISGGTPDGDRYLSFTSQWVGRRDARYNFAYGQSGRWGMEIDYNKIPHRFGNDGRILFAETAPGRWELADSIQSSLQSTLTQQFATNRNAITYAYLNNLLQPYLRSAALVDLELQRDRTRATIDLGKMGRMAWGLEYTHENRTGNRPYGAAFGFGNAIELPEPIDYTTDGAQLSGELNGKNGGLTFGYRYSRFKNDVDTLIFDNPFRITSSTDASAYQAPGSASVGGSHLGEADLAPDNEANWMFLNGRLKAAGWNFSGALSYGTMSQDDSLVPYTLNSVIQGENFDGTHFAANNAAFLPAGNSDSEVDVLNFTGSANTKFGKNITLNLRARYYDYDNKSPRIAFPGYVRYHGVWEEIGRITVPFAYTTDELSADLGWLIGKDSRLGFAYIRQSWDREFREIETSDEDILRLTYDTRMGPVELRAYYEMADRSIGHYETAAMEHSFIEHGEPNNLPDLRKYDEAAREYDAISVQGMWYVSENVDVAFGVTNRDDDYDESLFGLVGDELLQYNAEVSFALGEKGSLYIFGHMSEREVFQRARQSGATPSTNPLDDWTITFDEDNTTLGFGWNAKLSSRWNLDAHATWNESDGLADFFSPPGGAPNLAVGFDDYEDIEILSAKVALDYAINENLSAGLDYRYEDYTLDSFLTRGLTNYLPAALLLNGNFGDYTAHVIGLRFKMRM
jgi:MtrB/PioB family decaheme-associated outer membrane protein